MALIARRMEKRKEKRWRAPKGKLLSLRERQLLDLVVCSPPPMTDPFGEGTHRCQPLVNAGGPFLEWQPWLDKSTGRRGDLILQLGVNDPSFDINDYDLLWTRFVDTGIAEESKEWGEAAAAGHDRAVCLVGVRTQNREQVRKALTKFRVEKVASHRRVQTDQGLPSWHSPTWEAFVDRLNARTRQAELDKVKAQMSSTGTVR